MRACVECKSTDLAENVIDGCVYDWCAICGTEVDTEEVVPSMKPPQLRPVTHAVTTDTASGERGYDQQRSRGYKSLSGARTAFSSARSQVIAAQDKAEPAQDSWLHSRWRHRLVACGLWEMRDGEWVLIDSYEAES